MRLIVTADEYRASSLCDITIIKIIRIITIIIILLLTLFSSGLWADYIMRLHMACQQRCQSCRYCMTQHAPNDAESIL